MKKIALVLSGGAARGAYEVGVIKALLPEMKKHGGINIFCGTSVGSINACYLASTIHLPDEEIIEKIEHYWLTLKREHVFMENWAHAGLRSFLGSLRLGQPDFQGLLDNSQLRRILETEMDWNQLRKNIKDGLVHTLTISATSMSAGRSVVFYESNDPNCIKVIPRDPRSRFVPAEISADHLIASCSIPIFFKPVRLNFNDHYKEHGDWFCDGGLRQNTPLLPAITLGSDALIIVGLHYMNEDIDAYDQRPGLIPNIGKLLNAMFLDHVRNDAQRLHLINEIIEDLEDNKLLEKVNKKREERGERKLRFIPNLFISPSELISDLAEKVWDACPEARKNFKTLDWLFRLGNLKEHLRGDILSYFFFNPSYAQKLIDLGYKDGLEKISSMSWDPVRKKNVGLMDKFFGRV